MPLLDDFAAFVTDAQAAAYYRKWVRDNPRHAADWQTFRDGLLAGERPAPPDMGRNRYGCALVDAGRLYLDATLPQPAVRDSGCYFGARIDGQFYADKWGAPSNFDAPWSGPITGAGWDLFEQHVGKKVSAVHWGGPASVLPSSFDATANQDAHDRGAFSNYSVAASVAELSDLAAASDANGVLTQVDTWASAVAATGYPIMVRFCHEMNGDWSYPWQVASGTSQATYIAAWRTFHDRVAALAPNVSFFWCPNVKNATVPDPTPWFPGTAYVDWVGFDGYNHGTDGSPATIFDETLAIVTGLATGLPVGIGETGCEAPVTYTGGKSQWITDFFAWLAANPAVKTFSWFNQAGNPVRPHIEVGNAATTFDGEAQAAFAEGVADSRYLANVAGGFPAGAKLPPPGLVT